jgi:AmmeMemoRadiSam system protein B
MAAKYTKILAAAIIEENFIRIKIVYTVFILHARIGWNICMSLRKQSLPPGWYPQTAQGVSQFLDRVSVSNQVSGNPAPAKNLSDGTALAAVAPHAGWYYSGAIAARAVRSLRPDAQTVVIIGGHLPGGSRPLVAEEDFAATPLGELPMDRDFRIAAVKALGCVPDRYTDNTLEVLLPMVHYFFPGAKILLLRFPAELESYEAGRELARITRQLRRYPVVLGSTDLTHYGKNYDFSPCGCGGEDALTWVRDVNDANFIAAVKSGDPKAACERAIQDRSACSPGAVLGVMGFVAEAGVAKNPAPGAELLAYGTSAEVSPGEGFPDSFVGYGAFCWKA